MVTIRAGSYHLGSDRFFPAETPLLDVQIASFRIALAPDPRAHPDLTAE